ncbi:Uncharacterised protein [Halioglobus japonicus]|nr:Uncharacterised protein [Halioglobus japonicus]
MVTLKAIIRRIARFTRSSKFKPGAITHDKNVIRPHFDCDFYLENYPDVAADRGYDPLTHYCKVGWLELRDPCSDFSTNFYLRSNPDVIESGLNPFAHYLLQGKAQGRLPKMALQEEATPPPEPAPKKKADPLQENPHQVYIEQIRYHFDNEFYCQQAPDAAKGGADPVAHYFLEGWKEGLDPTPNFSTTYYLEVNPDIAKTNINPFWHYIVAGRKEGRIALPAQRASEDTDKKTKSDDSTDSVAETSKSKPAKQVAKKSPQQTIEEDLEVLRPHFDSAFYLTQNPDVASSNVEAIRHYLLNGWKDGRDPSPFFSTTFYLDTNPDVVRLGINPFLHYIVAGQHEGRAAQHPGGYKVERLRRLEPLEVTTGHWLRDTPPGELMNADQLEAMINDACGSEFSRLVLSLGHDHYREVSGGVQLCAHREELLSPAYGAVYLNIHPWQSLPRLAHIEDEPDTILVLVLNGKDMGKCRVSDLIQAVGETKGHLEDIQVVIHHLLGHLPERVVELIQAAGKDDCWMWLHDFFTVCPSFTLQRNQVSYCDAPKPDSNACSLCRFGVERQSHLTRMQDFFEAIDVHMLAPSPVSQKFWKGHTSLQPASIQVVPHVNLDWEKRTTPAVEEESDVITLAFLGTPAPHKGWNIFEKLFQHHNDDPRYRFVYFGTAAPPCSGIEHVPVHVTAEDSEAMITAVTDQKVDLVLHWASWPETFSLSTYEALAGSAYVITNPISGNVAATVRRLRRGAVLEDENDLLAFFTDGRAENMLKTLRNVRRAKQVTHRLNNMAYEAIGWEYKSPKTLDDSTDKPTKTAKKTRRTRKKKGVKK